MFAVAAACVALPGCVNLQDCQPEKEAGTGYPTGRVKCPIGGGGSARGVNLRPKLVQALVPDPVIALLGNVLGDGWVAQVSAPLSPSTFDATLMKLSTQGSNVAVATNSGTFTVELYSGSTIVAASVFPWIKNGAELIAAQPGAVNTWIKQYPNADGYTFNTKVTFTESAEDMTTVRTSQVYSGVTVSSTSQTLPTPRRTGPISPEQP